MAMFIVSEEDKPEEVRLADVKVSIASGRGKITLVLEYRDASAWRFSADMRALEVVRRAHAKPVKQPKREKRLALPAPDMLGGM